MNDNDRELAELAVATVRDSFKYDDDFEIDDGAAEDQVSIGDDGVWVKVWHWVSFEEIGIDEED